MLASLARADYVDNPTLVRQQIANIWHAGLQNADLGIGDRLGCRRRPDLVAHDAKLSVFAGELGHRPQEVGALRRINPGGTNDRVGRACRLDHVVAGQFARAADGDRPGRAVLASPNVAGAVERIVGRKMDHRHVMRAAQRAITVGASALMRNASSRSSSGGQKPKRLADQIIENLSLRGIIQDG